MSADDAQQPEVLVRVRSEAEAAVIQSILADAGILAQAVGGFTASFRAEAPGDVSVLVRREDLQRAKAVLAEVREQQEFGDFDHEK